MCEGICRIKQPGSGDRCIHHRRHTEAIAACRRRLTVPLPLFFPPHFSPHPCCLIDQSLVVPAVVPAGTWLPSQHGERGSKESADLKPPCTTSASPDQLVVARLQNVTQAAGIRERLLGHYPGAS